MGPSWAPVTLGVRARLAVEPGRADRVSAAARAARQERRCWEGSRAGGQGRRRPAGARWNDGCNPGPGKVTDQIEELDADVVIVGGGSAGSTAAIGAQKHLPV